MNIEYKGSRVSIPLLRSVCPFRVARAVFPTAAAAAAADEAGRPCDAADYEQVWSPSLFSIRQGEGTELSAAAGGSVLHVADAVVPPPPTAVVVV